MAASLNNLAGLYDTQGNYSKAEPLYKRSLAIRKKALSPDHPSVATSLNNLALLYRKQGNYSKVEPLYKRSLAIKEKALGPDQPWSRHYPLPPGILTVRSGSRMVPSGIRSFRWQNRRNP